MNYTYMRRKCYKKKSYEPVKILEGDFAISLHIIGSTWDKRIDPRIAKYVLLLQDSFDDLLVEYSEQATYDEATLMVKVEAREGSALPWTDISGFLKSVCTPMTPEMTFIEILVAIGGIAGAYYVHRYFEYKKAERSIEKDERLAELRKDEQEMHEQTIREAIKVLALQAQVAPEKFTSYERPVRHIVRTLEDEDTIQIGDSTLIPADIPRTEEQLTYGDGPYILEKRIYSEGELVLELSQGDIYIKAYLSLLDESDIKSFVDTLNMREQHENLPLTLNLQINIIHTARRLKHGEVLGMGEARSGKTCKTLQTLVNELKK